ncbi:MAG: YfhO family protein [Bryobacterales bacterium]|nr:YfhO family protein [Bryobacterales bacterium]
MAVAEKHHSGRIPAAFRFLAGPVLLFLITAGFYWKLTLTDQYTWLESPDIAYQVLPWYQMQAREWNASRFPLWDPYQWGGQSLIGQGQPGAAYPLNWILFRLPLYEGRIRPAFLNWYFVLIHYLAALFGYWLCRDLELPRTASLPAGSAFALGGYVGTTDWPQMLNGAVWAPLVLLFSLRALGGRRPIASAALSGGALGMAFLSGHHQVPLFTAAAVGLIWAWSLVRKRGQPLRPFLVFLLFTFLVSALQTLPGYEYGRLAVRWAGAPAPLTWNQPVPYTVHTHYSMNPGWLLGAVLPAGFPHATPYMGITAILLAALGLAAGWQAWGARIAAALALLGLAFALGAFSPFHGLAYALVPMLEKARNPSMAIVIFHIGIAVLSAYGIRHILADEQSRRLRGTGVALAGLSVFLYGFLLWAWVVKSKLPDERLGVPALAALLIAVILLFRSAGRISGSAASVSLFLVMLFELNNVSTYGLQPVGKPDSLLKNHFGLADLVDFLTRQPEPPRIEADEREIPFNFGDWHGIDVFGGYTASLPANIDRVQGGYEERMRFSVKYWVGRKPIRADQVPVFASQSGLNVYLNPGAYYRAWVENSKPCPNPGQAWMTSRGQGRVVVDAQLPCPARVVISEPYFPGWKARVAGRSVPIREVHGALRAVDLPAGRHTIVMTYRPLSVYAGAALTALGLLGCALLALPSRSAPRRTL